MEPKKEIMKLAVGVFVFIALFFLQEVSAIELSKSVNHLSLELTQYGELRIKRRANSRIERIEVLLFLPKDDDRQEVEILSITPRNYEIFQDEYGNERIKLIWLSPEEDSLRYEVRTKVEIFSRSNSDPYDERFLKETELTKPSKGIIEKALEFKGKGMEGLAELAIWVNENIVYDETLKDEVKPADWVFENRRGTCDEFSNLFVSMARVLGFPSRYVSGLAYSREFEKHAWVEVFIEGKWIPFDPTWLEGGYLDGTHLKLADLPDANSTEKIFVKGLNVDVVWTGSNFKTKILDKKEEIPFKITTDVINRRVPPGGYSIFRASIYPRECMIISLILKSCVWMEKEVFEVLESKRNSFVCEPEDVYWVFRQKGVVEEGFIYTCPLVLNTEFGFFSVENVTIDPEERAGKLRITPRRVAVAGGKKFKVLVVPERRIDLHYLYSGKLTSIPLEREAELEFNAPEDVGKYTLWFVGSDGSGSSLELEVLEKKLVKILNVEFPRNVTEKESFFLNVTLRSLVDEELRGTLTLVSEERTQKPVVLNPQEIKTESFNLSFENAGLKDLKIILDVGKDFDVKVFEVSVLPPKEVSFFNSIVRFLSRIAESMVSFLRRFLGLKI